MGELVDKTVFVTGASRGIGAATAVEFGRRGYSVGIGVREKVDRAVKVGNEVLGANPDAEFSLFQGDITDADERARIISEVGEWAPQLGGLVLNAAGGLEKGKGPNYGLLVNRDAQIELTRGLTEALTPNGTVVYVTSHWAHLHGQVELPPFDYEVVASSKHAGEEQLRAMIPELTEREIRLIVVSGGLVTGTFVGDFAGRRFPEFTEQQRAIDNVVTAEDMAERIVDVIEDRSLPSGHTEVVGAPLEALTEGA